MGDHVVAGWALLGGASFLVASTLFAILCHLENELMVGLGPDELERVVEREVEDPDLLRLVVPTYVEGIRWNREAVDASTARLRTSLYLLLVAVILLATATGTLMML